MAIPSDGSLKNLNRPYVFNGWYPQGFIDQFIRKIPFQALENPTTQVGWNKLNAFTPLSAGFYDPITGSPTALGVDFDLVTKQLQRIGDIVLVDSLGESASGNTNDLLDAEIQAAKISIIRTLGAQIIQGSGSPPSLNGLASEVISSQQFNVVMSAGLPSFKDLLQLLNMVRASDGCVGGGVDCIVTHERVIRWIVSQFQQWGMNFETSYDADLGTIVPLFRGIPMYAGQVALVGGAYDIWALKMSGPTGIRMVHATGRADQFGIDVTPVPMQATQSRIGAFVGGIYALMVPEPQSIARLQGTTDTALGTQTMGAGIAVLP